MAETDFYPDHPGMNGARHCEGCRFAPEAAASPMFGYSLAKHFLIEFVNEKRNLTEYEKELMLAKCEVDYGEALAQAMDDCSDCPEEFVLTVQCSDTFFRKAID